MDAFLAALDSHRNLLVGVCLGVLAVFLFALTQSDWSNIGQALGNVVGSAIGAVGAAGAVVWQLRSQERKESREITELRRAAFRNVRSDIVGWIYRMEGAAQMLAKGMTSEAAKHIRTGPMGSFTVVEGLAEQLRQRSVSDIDALTDLEITASRVWKLARQIEQAGAVTDVDQNDLAAGFLSLCGEITDFAHDRLEVVGIGSGARADVDLIEITLRNAGLPATRLGWLFRSLD